MIIGLVAKNAILIVEFAEAERRRKGSALVAAALAGAKASISSDLNDIARFHCRLHALSSRFGSRSGGSSSDGDSRNRRNARRLSGGQLLYSGRFLFGRRAGRLDSRPHQDWLAGQAD